MTALWILGAAILVMLFFWWAFQPKQGERAANAPQNVRRQPLSSDPINRSHPSWPSLNAEAQDLLTKGHKILAIKLIREQTGWGLKKAKRYVENLVHPVDAPEAHQAPAKPLTQKEREEEVRQLVMDGKKITAIKRVREQTGWGLRESKDYVEALFLTEKKDQNHIE